MNKLRLVLRFCFAAGLITMGVDVSTKQFRVTRNRYEQRVRAFYRFPDADLLSDRFANDFVFITLVMTFWLSNVISLMVRLKSDQIMTARKADDMCAPQLYLPVTWHKVTGANNGMMARRRTAAADPGFRQRRRSSFQGGLADKADHKMHDGMDEDPSQLMTQHSIEHRTLVTLLRERGTIAEDERVPEDALFYSEPSGHQHGAPSTSASTPKETRVGRYDHGDFESESGYGFQPAESSSVPVLPAIPTMPVAPTAMSAKRGSSYSEKIFGSKLPSAVSPANTARNARPTLTLACL